MSCTFCARGYSKSVPQVPGSSRCVPLPESNPFCLIPDSQDNTSCLLCEEGKYMRHREVSGKMVHRCEDYNNVNKIDLCFNYGGSEILHPSNCHICKAGKQPSLDVNAGKAPKKRMLPQADLKCIENTSIADCEITMVIETGTPQLGYGCMLCKEGKYRIDNSCTGIAW